jgi:hypothetical protein
LSIKFGESEEDDEVVSRYINGLKNVIQYELNMVRIWFVMEAYEIALKIEEKI